ncbi:MAG: alpha-L-fucosidase [Phycisphaerales bacterium]
MPHTRHSRPVRFASALALLVGSTIAVRSAAGPDRSGQESSLAKPTPAQLAWQDHELGVFIHFAPNTWQDQEADDLTTPLSEINPRALDTDEWVAAAKAMGAGYLVFTAKHVGGFCWWPTETTEYSVKHVAWKNGEGDLMADLAASCRRAGLGLGVYLSPADRSQGVGVGGTADDPDRQAAYEAMYRTQLTELLTNYGPIEEVWFDGSLVFDVGDILRRHAPRAMVFQGPQATIRWVGNEEGVCPPDSWNAVEYDETEWGRMTARHSSPRGDRWAPIECDARLRDSWFWRTDNVDTIKSVDDLMAMYHASVGHGANLLLNLTPDRTGAIPSAEVERVAEFGAEIRRRYGRPLASTSGLGVVHEIALGGDARFDAIILMEDLAFGERVRRWSIEAFVDGEWRPIAHGRAIGHKRIVRVDPIQATKARLRVSDAVGEPAIRGFSVYSTEPPPPSN